MTIKETPPEWKKYRQLIDETSELEYQIIGILTSAVCRKEGDGHPTSEETIQINELKTRLTPKLKELENMKTGLSEFIQFEKAINSGRLSR